MKILPRLPIFANRARAYRTLFTGDERTGMHPDEARAIVMKDLISTCRAQDTTFVAGDPYASARNAGKREIFLRIQKMSRLTQNEIADMAEFAEGDDV